MAALAGAGAAGAGSAVGAVRGDERNCRGTAPAARLLPLWRRRCCRVGPGALLSALHLLHLLNLHVFENRNRLH